MIFSIAGNPSARPNFARLFPESSAKKNVETGAEARSKENPENGTFRADCSSDRQEQFPSLSNG